MWTRASNANLTSIESISSFSGVSLSLGSAGFSPFRTRSSEYKIKKQRIQFQRKTKKSFKKYIENFWNTVLCTKNCRTFVDT